MAERDGDWGRWVGLLHGKRGGATDHARGRGEDAVANLEKEARRALQFLNLPWEDSVLQYRDRLKEKVVSSPTYEAVSQPLYTRAIGRWRNYEEFLQPILSVLEPSVKAFAY